MYLTANVVDLQLLFVCCVQTVQFNQIFYMYTAGWKQSNSPQNLSLLLHLVHLQTRLVLKYASQSGIGV